MSDVQEPRLEGSADRVCVQLLEAISFAASRHRYQKRKDTLGTPYVNHPIGVACILLEVGQVRDAGILVAALLHDTLEDTATTEEELARLFGQRVCALVKEVTDDKRLKKDQRKRRQILRAPSLSEGARLIRLADKIANVQDLVCSPPRQWSPFRCLEYVAWAEEVVAAMGEVHEDLNSAFRKAADEAVRHWRSLDPCSSRG